MIIILLPQTLATDKMKRQRCIRKRSMARNHRMLRVLETIYLLAVMIQTIQAIQGSNRRPTNNRRQRLNPLTEASPESHQRIKRLLHRINKFHNSPQRRNLKLSDHLNFNILDNVREDDATPSTRRWSIQLKALPIWICQNDSKNQDNCHDTVEQEQDDLILQLQQLFPSMTLVAQVQHVLNSIFVELPFDAEIPAHLSGVENIALEEHYQIAQVEKSVLETIGSKFANSYCFTGQGVKVGILDTGVDYTHDALGGSGTREAYLAAYGVDRDAPENKNRDGLFPTSTVVQGKDFLGEYDELYFEDDDPIDANGHGTAVASALLAVAPDVDIVAVKVCITGPQALCPESALVKGIQFMLDPNGIGSLDDKVDVINLSLTTSFNNPFYDRTALALENAAQLGVLCVTAFGNYQNIPYISGAIGGTPNVISVGATNQPSGPLSKLYMDTYSARGPGEANIIKPDLSAPGTLSLAVVGSGNQFAETSGTSFAAPLVAGAAALVKQHCPMCDPFAIKCILMNTAQRNIAYGPGEEEERRAPVTRMGSGMVRLDMALNSTLWAFSLEERQPSLSFGIVDAFLDFIFTKTIRVRPIDSRPRTLQFGYEFRNASRADVVNITFLPAEIELAADCKSFVDVQVQFYVNARVAPPNTMTTSGFRAFDPTPLDLHEYDGHLLISSVIDQEASLPFHLIVRQAAFPAFRLGSGLPFQWGPVDKNFTITNEGFGTAQIDAFELVFSDGDDEEADYGVLEVSSDIRSIGYRTIPVGKPGCNFTVEFSFQTWERSTHVGKHIFTAEIHPSADGRSNYTMAMLTYPFVAQTYVIDDATNTSVCSGFPVDHSSNTANTIMRACSNDLFLEYGSNFSVQFRALAYPMSLSTSFLSSEVKLQFPEPRLRSHSYDIGALESLEEFHVEGEISPESYGLQLVTNSFRDWSRTGAASASTETLLLVKQGIVLETEKTPDVISWPGLFNQTGPTCGLVLFREPECPLGNGKESDPNKTQIILEFEDTRQTPSPNCPPIKVPRLDVPTPSPTSSPSDYPTRMTVAPSRQPTQIPTVIQTSAPPVQSPAQPGGKSASSQVFRLGSMFTCVVVAISILIFS